MEGNIECSPKLGFPVDYDDEKYVSRLSTILVATIQEAKDRISQIEYIFCGQLYSNFQTKSKTLQKVYLDAKKEAEDEWKEKEKYLLDQIKRLELEKKEVEENRCSKDEKDGRNEGPRICELEKEVRRKSKEVDEGMELHNKLLQLVQTKSAMLVDTKKQLKEYEERINDLVGKVKIREMKLELYEDVVRQKKEKLAATKQLAEELSKINETLTSQLADRSLLLDEHEKEKKELVKKSECLERNVGELQKKLEEKMEEIEEGRMSQARLLQQIDVNNVEILKQKQQLEESENDKRLLLERVNGLEAKVDELQENVSRSNKLAEGKDSSEELLKQIELKDSQLLAEKKKQKSLLDMYKSLKSQYNFLLARSGLTEENMLPHIKLEDESSSLMHQQNPTTSPGFESKCLDSAAACEMKKVKIENEIGDGLEDRKVFKCPSTTKSAPVIGKKRPASRWIDTRSHQNREGPDPHDDFLNTPLENLRGNLNNVVKEKIDDYCIPLQKDVHSNGSDDETQDMNVDPGREKKEMPLPVAGQKGFKYVEPVRKKAERDNLKGVECKQCKKFYDAVLPNGGRGADDNMQNFRCEHHDGVSKHRYKYVPPMTPEGFWNIGFESEM